MNTDDDGGYSDVIELEPEIIRKGPALPGWRRVVEWILNGHD